MGSPSPTFKATNKTLTVDAGNLIPLILAAVTGPDKEELTRLANAIDTGKATKHDVRQFNKLLSKTHKRISN